MRVETFSPEETFQLGRSLGQSAKAGEIYTLCGDLGTGKTVFTQGFAAGLGIREPVCSPTFTIVQEYGEGRLPLYHFDVYRIGDPEEMEEIGYEDYFYGDGVCLIEWADLIEELLPEQITRVRIGKEPEKGFDYRSICIEGEAEERAASAAAGCGLYPMEGEEKPAGPSRASGLAAGDSREAGERGEEA